MIVVIEYLHKVNLPVWANGLYVGIILFWLLFVNVNESVYLIG